MRLIFLTSIFVCICNLAIGQIISSEGLAHFDEDIERIVLDTSTRKYEIVIRTTSSWDGNEKDTRKEKVSFRFVNDSVLCQMFQFVPSRIYTWHKAYLVLKNDTLYDYNPRTGKRIPPFYSITKRDSAGFVIANYLHVDGKDTTHEQSSKFKLDSLGRVTESMWRGRMKYLPEYLYRWEYEGDSLRRTKIYKTDKDSLVLDTEIITIRRKSYDGTLKTSHTTAIHHIPIPYQDSISYSFEKTSYEFDENSQLTRAKVQEYYNNEPEIRGFFIMEVEYKPLKKKRR